MAPPAKKRIRISKKEREAFEREQLEGASEEEEEEEEEDEWKEERRIASTSSGSNLGQQSLEQYSDDDEEEDDNNGVATYESDEGEYESEEDEEVVLHKQLASIPFSSLLKAKKKMASASAKASTSRSRYGGQDDDEDEEDEETSQSMKNSRNNRELLNAVPSTKKPIQKQRANGSLMKADRSSKHAPMEMSSKRTVGRTRTIVETRADKSRDPRFDSLSGAFKQDLFSSSYSFLEKARTAELEDVRRTAVLARKSAVLSEEEKQAIENTLVKLQSKEVANRTKARETEALREWKKEENKKRDAGKKDFYLKKSDQKAVVLKAKFETLSKDKKLLRKAVEKKRRKTDQKDKKSLPEKRKRAE